MKSNVLDYIQGYRGFAVLAVVIYHFSPTSLPGGFLGVDLFFVISGFVIYLALDRSLGNNFSYVNFMFSRIMRIAPALLVMTLIVLSLGWIAPPFIWKNAALSSIFSDFFVSNLYYLRTSGYFDISSTYKLFIHTWSLGVEFQFYILAPFVVWLSRNLNRNNKFIVLVVILFSSFGLLLASSNVSEGFLFYSPTSRAFQFLCGFMSAFIYMVFREDKNNCIFVVFDFFFFSFFAFCFLFLKKIDVFYLIAFTLSCSWLLFSQSKKIFFLHNRYLLLLGTASFSIYLWHQPIFVLANFFSYHWVVELIVFLSVFIFGALSYYFIESFFRKRMNLKGGVFVAVMLVINLSLAVMILKNDGFESYIYSKQQLKLQQSIKVSPYRSKCHTGGANYMKPDLSCVLGEGSRNIAVLGDSHGVELSFSLSEKLKSLKYDYSVVQLTYSDCKPDFSMVKIDSCSEWFQKSINYLSENNQVDHIILAFRWNSILLGDHSYVYPEIASLDNGLINYRKKQVEDFIVRASNAGKKITILEQPPELHKDINLLISDDDWVLSFEGVERGWYEKRRKMFKTILKNVPNINVVNPASKFCDDHVCFGADSEGVYYFDSHHLTPHGTDRIVKLIVKGII